MARGKKIYSTMVKNYINFAFLSIPIFIVSSFIAVLLVILTLWNYTPPRITASSIAKVDYLNMYTKDVEKTGGWVEVISEGKVIYVKGNKKDDTYSYSRDEIMSYQKGRGPDRRFKCSLTTLSDGPGRIYYYLVKIPSESMKENVKNYLDFNNPVFGDTRTLLFVFFESTGTFFLIFVFSVFVYGKHTSKKITGPLESIMEGIRRMTSGDYSVRLDFEAESEFAEIRDAFNFLTEKLQNAEKENKQLEESKKRLIIGISHDLKTPITTICGYTKALNEGMAQDEEKQKRYLRFIYDKSISVNHIIDELFRYTKMDMRNYQLKTEHCDFVEFVRQTVATHYMEIEDKKFELNLDIPEDEIIFDFDRTEMYRALSNILTNCVKYNPAGTIINIILTEKDSAAVLKIGDNGAGMSKELQQEVFDEFVRGDAARPSDGGSGLGLAISKKIIETHGGSIELSSEPDKGSEFTICFPLSENTAPTLSGMAGS